MDVNKNDKTDNIESSISIALGVLKKQLNRYNFLSESMKSKMEFSRSQNIEKLMTEEKCLAVKCEQIKKEIKRYEKKYEKALKKKVKLMKLQIKEDKQKLEIIKQKYCSLSTEINVAAYKTGEVQENSKKVRRVIKVKTMKPKSKQKNVSLSKNIKIKIKRNAKLGKPEMHFVTDGNGQNSFIDLVRVIKPMTINTQDCRVMLQKLTKEQMNRYVSQKGLNQQKNKRKRATRSLEKVNENNADKVQPNWHIKIPKSVFEESQKEIKNVDLNTVLSR